MTHQDKCDICHTKFYWNQEKVDVLEEHGLALCDECIEDEKKENQ